MLEKAIEICRFHQDSYTACCAMEDAGIPEGVAQVAHHQVFGYSF